MARPLKSGIDYFPLDTTNDDKLNLIEAEFGLVGWAIIIKVWCRVYETGGYFTKWGKDESLLFTKKNNVDISLINDVIVSGFCRHLFDEKLHKKFSILTSRGIQKRFFEIIRRRVKVEVIKNYLLINVNTYSNLEIVTINSQSKVKESKEKKSKLFKKPTLEEVTKYCTESGNGINPNEFFDSNETKGWVVGKYKTPMKDWKAAIRTWENNRKKDTKVKATTFKQKKDQEMDTLFKAVREDDEQSKVGNGSKRID